MFGINSVRFFLTSLFYLSLTTQTQNSADRKLVFGPRHTHKVRSPISLFYYVLTDTPPPSTKTSHVRSFSRVETLCHHHHHLLHMSRVGSYPTVENTTSPCTLVFNNGEHHHLLYTYTSRVHSYQTENTTTSSARAVCACIR